MQKCVQNKVSEPNKTEKTLNLGQTSQSQFRQTSQWRQKNYQNHFRERIDFLVCDSILHLKILF